MRRDCIPSLYPLGSKTSKLELITTKADVPFFALFSGTNFYAHFLYGSSKNEQIAANQSKC